MSHETLPRVVMNTLWSWDKSFSEKVGRLLSYFQFTRTFKKKQSQNAFAYCRDEHFVKRIIVRGQETAKSW
ncbi:hypothetical protein B0E44_11665 [Flavobacterium sp. A45]|nr:hypothetical protein B0E44_11665 [Flavobacterium sp. A45]